MKESDYSQKSKRHRIYKKARRYVVNDWSCYFAVMKVTGLNATEVRQHFTELRQSFKDIPVGVISRFERINHCIKLTKPDSWAKRFINRCHA